MILSDERMNPPRKRTKSSFIQSLTRAFTRTTFRTGGVCSLLRSCIAPPLSPLPSPGKTRLECGKVVLCLSQHPTRSIEQSLPTGPWRLAHQVLEERYGPPCVMEVVFVLRGEKAVTGGANDWRELRELEDVVELVQGRFKFVVLVHELSLRWKGC